jgi:hypothetical protein
LYSTFDEYATTIFMPPYIGQNTLTTKMPKSQQGFSAFFVYSHAVGVDGSGLMRPSLFYAEKYLSA